MSKPLTRRLVRVRASLHQTGQQYGDWLGVVVRAHLIAELDGVDPPPDEETLTRHWGVTTAEAASRAGLHRPYLTDRHPDLWAMLQDPDGHPDLVRRLAEHGHPVFPGFPRFGDTTAGDRTKGEVGGDVACD